MSEAVEEREVESEDQEIWACNSDNAGVLADVATSGVLRELRLPDNRSR